MELQEWQVLLRRGREKIEDQNADLVAKVRSSCTPRFAEILGVTQQEFIEIEVYRKMQEIIDSLRGREDDTVFLIRLGAASTEEAEMAIAAYQKHIEDILN
ncbi:hypothetical protein [Alcaligenes nematophilus]|uniref:hypothetical protein n=1 Tax=Alcaligenes nematophilus TaxID=2994643 RepID=UPI00384F4C54